MEHLKMCAGVLAWVTLLALLPSFSSGSLPTPTPASVAFVPMRGLGAAQAMARLGLCAQQRGEMAGTFGGPLLRTGAVRPPRIARPLRCLSGTRRQQLTCQVGGGFMEDGDMWGDDDMFLSAGLDGDGGADWRTVLLKDAKLGRTIECFVDREIEVDGKQYATLMPADTPVIMAGYKEVNGSKHLVPVLEDKAIDELFPTASAVLSEMDLSLSRSAVVMTVEEVDGLSFSDSEDEDDDDIADEFVVLGLGPDGETSVRFSLLGDDEDDSDDFDDDEGVLSLGTGPNGPIGLRMNALFDEEDGEIETLPRLSEDSGDDDDASDEDDTGEKVQVLANFYYKGEKYVVATPLEPVLIIGSPTGKGAEVKSEIRVSNDMQTISSLPGASGLQGALEDAEDANRAEYVLPDREELERITPKIEQELESMLDEEEKDRKVLALARQQLINQWGRAD